MTVIPWYLIPGRRYPIQVYLYACKLYSSEPGLGQRGAAKATRAKFKLETFSHSTVSRTFKSLEETRKSILKSKFGEEVRIEAAEAQISVPALGRQVVAAPKSDPINAQAAHRAARFPSIADTANRRKEMAVFFRKFFPGTKTSEIETAGRQFMSNWHEKNRRLLL